MLDYYIQAVSNLSTNKLISRRKRYPSSPSKRIVNQIEARSGRIKEFVDKEFATERSKKLLWKSFIQSLSYLIEEVLPLDRMPSGGA